MKEQPHTFADGVRSLGSDFHAYAVALEERERVNWAELNDRDWRLIWTLVPIAHQEKIEHVLKAGCDGVCTNDEEKALSSVTNSDDGFARTEDCSYMHPSKAAADGLAGAFSVVTPLIHGEKMPQTENGEDTSENGEDTSWKDDVDAPLSDEELYLDLDSEGDDQAVEHEREDAGNSIIDSDGDEQAGQHEREDAGTSSTKKKKRKKKKKKKSDNSIDRPVSDRPNAVKVYDIDPADKDKIDKLNDWLAKGAHMSRQKARDTTLLFDAASVGHEEATKALLAKPGIRILKDVEMGDSVAKYTPLHVAAMRGHPGVVDLLLQRPEAQVNRGADTPLLLAASWGRTEVVRVLLRHSNIDVEKPRHDGVTAILASCFHGHTEVARMLLEAGAEKNKVGNDGWTPLCVACDKGRIEIVKILLSIGGVELDKTTNDGLTPMGAAARAGHADVVKMLAEAGADMEKKTNVGATPLHMACERGHLDVVNVLLDCGADKDKASDQGATPLLMAAAAGNSDIVEALVNAGAMGHGFAALMKAKVMASQHL